MEYHVLKIVIVTMDIVIKILMYLYVKLFLLIHVVKQLKDSIVMDNNVLSMKIALVQNVKIIFVMKIKIDYHL
jgi:hypothetical protein